MDGENKQFQSYSYPDVVICVFLCLTVGSTPYWSSPRLCLENHPSRTSLLTDSCLPGQSAETVNSKNNSVGLLFKTCLRLKGTNLIISSEYPNILLY